MYNFVIVWKFLFIRTYYKIHQVCFNHRLWAKRIRFQQSFGTFSGFFGGSFFIEKLFVECLKGSVLRARMNQCFSSEIPSVRGSLRNANDSALFVNISLPSRRRKLVLHCPDFVTKLCGNLFVATNWTFTVNITSRLCPR